MKKGIISILLIAWGFTSCIKDHTTDADPMFSSITILSDYDTLSVNLSEPLVYSVKIDQEGKTLPVAYEWAYATYNTNDKTGYPAKDSLRVISNEAELRYTFRKLGTYYLRLKVDNGEAIAFKGFVLNVSTPYDEGITILSEDAAGKPRVSFMKTLSRQEIDAGIKQEFVTDVLTKENPDITIGACTDLAQYGNYLLLAEKDKGLIYKLNAKTFGVMYENKVREIVPGFTCIELAGSGTKNWMITADGNAYRYDLVLDEVLVIDQALGLDIEGYHWGYSSSYQYFLNYTNSMIYSPGVNLSTSGTSFKDYHILGLVHYTITKLYTITVSRDDPSKGVVFTSSGSFKNPKVLINFDAKDLKLDRHSTILYSSVYKYAYYNYGKGIYRWNCTGQLPNVPIVELTGNKEITALDMDPEKKLLYVCFVDNDRTDLKGGLFIYNLDDFTLESVYEGIADRPLRVFYKVK